MVTIVDCNDNTPIFQPLSPTSYSFSVDENSLQNTVVGTIAATDADETGNPNSGTHKSLFNQLLRQKEPAVAVQIAYNDLTTEK